MIACELIASSKAVVDKAFNPKSRSIMSKERIRKITYCCGVCDKTLEEPHQAYICRSCGSSENLFVIYKEEDPPSISVMYTAVDWHGG
jgi:hypothetical protein